MGRGKKAWKREMKKQKRIAKQMSMLDDRLLCTYQKDGVTHKLYERPDKSRYTLEIVSGKQKEFPKKEKNIHGGTTQLWGGGTGQNWTKKTCKHIAGEKGCKVGDFTVYPFSYTDTSDKELAKSGLKSVYALTNTLFTSLYTEGYLGVVYGMAFPDRGVLPRKVHNRLCGAILEEAKAKQRVGFYCTGGHGRTGTILASLIAMIEKPEDPIEVARKRYCEEAVESKVQAELVFSMMGKKITKKYEEEFKPFVGYSSAGTTATGPAGEPMEKYYGYSWLYRAAQAHIPQWAKDCSYLEMPLLREVDTAAHDVYGPSLDDGLPDPRMKGPMQTGLVGLAPAHVPNTWWVVSKVTGNAVRVAFKSKDYKDGTMIEFVEKLHRDCWKHVPVDSVEYDALKQRGYEPSELGSKKKEEVVTQYGTKIIVMGGEAWV